MNEEINRRVAREEFEQLTVYVEERLAGVGGDSLTGEVDALRMGVRSMQKTLGESIEGVRRDLGENREALVDIQQAVADKADRLELKNAGKDTERRLASMVGEFKKAHDKVENVDRELKKGVMAFKKEVRDRVANFVKSSKDEEERLREQIEEATKAQNDMRQLNEVQLAETVKFVQNVSDKSAAETSGVLGEIRRQVAGLAEDIRTLDSHKLSLEHFEEFSRDMQKTLKEKCSAKENKALGERMKESLQAEVGSLREELDGLVNSFRKELKQLLKRKVEGKDFAAHLEECAGKKELLELRSLVLARLEENSKRLSMAERQLIETGDLHKYLRKIDDYDKHIEQIQMKVQQLDPLKKMNKLVADRASLEDLRKMSAQMSVLVERKVDREEIKTVLGEQAQFNEFFSAESIVARYKWRSGDLLERNLIPWDVEVVNTLKDNFLWTDGGSTIAVANGGLYEVKFGVFGAKKPQLKLILNDQVILALTGQKETEKEKSSKFKDQPKLASTGTTFIDYFLLPNRSKLSVKCIGGAANEGFIDIKRL